uniref:Uncharacterized protein n=1 Tax=Anguilla anguilla TaxID=7936 RepID=A0A0E9QUG5_ANGAN
MTRSPKSRFIRHKGTHIIFSSLKSARRSYA